MSPDSKSRWGDYDVYVVIGPNHAKVVSNNIEQTSPFHHRKGQVMLIRKSVKRWRPRGKILVMTVLLLPALLGLMALSTDVGIICAGRAQMQVAADAGALAGAMKLVADQRLINSQWLSSLSSETKAAQAQAKKIAQANKVLNATPVINDNATNSASGDVVVGFFNPATHVWTPPPLPVLLSPDTNAVKVTVTRSSDHGGVIPDFFSRIWNYTGTTVSMSATAMAQNYPIKGFKPAGSANAALLPIVLDIVTWKAMMAGLTTDQYTYTASTNTVSNGADGIYESQIFPVGSGPGNWGTINIGTTSNSTSTLGAQILSGITPAQLATYPNSTIQLDPSLSPPSITFTGNPGINSTIQKELTSIIGKQVILPIYDIVTPQGGNATYRVVYFQPVRIVNVNFSGSSRYVIVQPSYVLDSTAIAITDPSQLPLGWNWTQGGVIKTHLVK